MVTVTVAPAAGRVQSTPQSGGTPAPVAGGCPTGCVDPLVGLQPVLTVPAPAGVVRMLKPWTRATTVAACPSGSAAVTHLVRGTFHQTNVARLTKPVVAGLVT